MITLNIITDNADRIQARNPTDVEVYIGAMEDYEHFDLGGVRWKLPKGMLEDLLTLFTSSPEPSPAAADAVDAPPRPSAPSAPQS